VREISHPHPGSPRLTSPHNISKYIRLWKNNQISSPHLPGYLCTARSSTPSIWPLTHHCRMG
jgi:hypothetical protein